MQNLEVIETPRLLLVRLNEKWMGKFSQNPKESAAELENSLSLEHSERTEHPPSAYQYACSEISRFPESAEVEIGYGIDTGFQRMGFGLEAVGKGIQWAFSRGARAVIAKVNPGNKASRRLLEKAGLEQYSFIGKMPCYRMIHPDYKGKSERI